MLRLTELPTADGSGLKELAVAPTRELAVVFLEITRQSQLRRGDETQDGFERSVGSRKGADLQGNGAPLRIRHTSVCAPAWDVSR
jgi:hypothetical protein